MEDRRMRTTPSTRSTRATMTRHTLRARRCNMARTVYVVMGSAGEYSDHNEWPVRAFLSEQRAADLVVKASARAREVFAIHDCDEFYSHREDEKFQNKYDPDMELSYTGANYNVMEAELDEEV
jgi:hypothetical protein